MAGRLLVLLVLSQPVHLAAIFLTMLVFFRNEHPFQTNDQADYEKLPAALGTYVAIPAWFLWGLFAGYLSAWGSQAVRLCFLLTLGIVLAGLSLFLPSAFWARAWPAWAPALAAFAAALLASLFLGGRRAKKCEP